MSGPAQTFERRRLNEEIELSFITAAKAACNVEMKLFSGKGSISGDLQDFYNQFSYLYRLTGHLKEMETSDPKENLAVLKSNISGWMKLKIGNTQPNQIESMARAGLKMFDDYYHALMHHGVIALPTRKG